MKKNHKIKKLVFNSRSYVLLFITLSLLAIFTSNRNDFKQTPQKIKITKQTKPTIIPSRKISVSNKNNLLNDYKIKAQATYPILVKQQIQIEELQTKYDNLENKLKKINHKDRLSDIIIAFIDLEKNIYFNKPYKRQLQQIEILAKSDLVLIRKIEELKSFLKKGLYDKEDLLQEFETLIPQILSQEAKENKSLFGKIKHNLSKSISVRRIDGKILDSSDNLDLTIFNIQKTIQQEQYSKSCAILSSAPFEYKEIVKDFHSKVTNRANIQNKISEIFSYLKELNND